MAGLVGFNTASDISEASDCSRIAPGLWETQLPTIPCVTREWPRLLVAAHRNHPPSELQAPPLTHHFLILQLSGVTDLTFRGCGFNRQAHTVKGDLFLVPAGSDRYWRWTTAVDVLHLHIAPETVTNAAAQVCPGDPCRVELTTGFGFRTASVRELCLLLQAEAREQDALDALYADSLTQALAIALVRHNSNVAIKNVEFRGGLPRHQLRQALEYIDAHLTAKLSLAELAAVIGRSPYHFCRLFKQSTGASPHQYVLQQRIERAQQMMREGRCSLAEISLTLGFSNQSHFTNVFRKLVGESPRLYREAATRLDQGNPVVPKALRSDFGRVDEFVHE